MISSADNHHLQWAAMPGNNFRVCERTASQLPAGAYACAPDEMGNAVFSRRNLKVDELIDFPESLAGRILNEIDQFWNLGEQFHKYGFLHRRGYLLHGKQGCGKSSLVHLIVSRAVEQGCVALFCENLFLLAEGAQQFRVVEPNRPILCIFEDIDTLVRYSGDSELLQWLDGNRLVDKVVNIATTNFPEKLGRRITSRPRRFDRVLKIDLPDAKLREAYFARKVPDLSSDERKQWVDVSRELSFAAMAELIISVRCLDHDLLKTAESLRELDRHEPSSEEYEFDGCELASEKSSRSDPVWSEFADCIPF